MKGELLKRFPDKIEVVGEKSDVRGTFDVVVVGGDKVHSKTKDGYVDNGTKLNALCERINQALAV